MRRTMGKQAAAILVLLAAAAPAAAEGNANFFLGLRSLDEESWFPVGDQQTIGGQVDFGVRRWPIHLVAEFSVSRKNTTLSGFDFTGSVTEAGFGVMKLWEPGGAAQPYVGGGLAFLYAKQEVSTSGTFATADDTDTALGIYANGGFVARIGESFNLGVDIRLLEGANVDLFGNGGRASYFQAAVLAGWSWD